MCVVHVCVVHVCVGVCVCGCMCVYANVSVWMCECGLCIYCVYVYTVCMYVLNYACVFAYMCACLSLQVDELTRNVNQISLKAEKIKHNQNVMLATLQNQGKLRERDCCNYNFIPRPLPHPVFERLQYANMEGEGQGDLVMCVTSGRHAGDVA